MSKCDLSIELTDGKRTYQIGEIVRGAVHVAVDADCSCDKLTLTHQWQTHGRGNRARGEENKQVLFEGQWRAGESASYPFEFEVPAGPLTFHGHLLNVD